MRRMLINTQPDEVRVAITREGLLVDFDIERPEIEQTQNNIYKAIITSIEPSLGAVFVEYDKNKRHGFLPFKEISPEYYNRPAKEGEEPNMHEVLSIGNPLVVQIDKEERGTKGAALTTYLSLAGSFLVLMPNNPRAGGVSRRIDGEERDQMREIMAQLEVPENMGLIIRTAGVGRNLEELQWDLKDLLRYWEAIQLAVHDNPDKSSFLIHQESDVITRAIRDNLRQDTTEIIVDDKEAYERAKQYIRKIRPDFVDRLKLYTNPLPLFSSYHIEQQIETAYQREVRLPSGGSIVIDSTEALVCIDINSARATRGSNIEETALNTNLEAADEIARQLRLRDIGGLIVIDFIDMTPVKNQRDVENQLKNALAVDRARIQVGRISRFGLLEMSRQRLRPSLAISNQTACPHCHGLGLVRSIESLALSILHSIQEQAAKTDYKHFQVQVPIALSTYLMNEKRASIHDTEKLYGIHIALIPNPELETPNYIIRHYRADNTRAQITSYKVIDGKHDPMQKKPSIPKPAEPIIQAYLPKEELPPLGKSSSGGLIKRLWGKMFSHTEATPASNLKPSPRPGHKRSTGNNRPSFEKRGPRQQRSDRTERTERTDRLERTERSDRSERFSNRSEQRTGDRPNNRRGSRGGQQQRHRRPAESTPNFPMDDSHSMPEEMNMQPAVQKPAEPTPPISKIEAPIVAPTPAAPVQEKAPAANSPDAILAAAGFGKDKTSKMIQVKTRKTDTQAPSQNDLEDNADR